MWGPIVNTTMYTLVLRALRLTYNSEQAQKLQPVLNMKLFEAFAKKPELELSSVRVAMMVGNRNSFCGLDDRFGNDYD